MLAAVLACAGAASSARAEGAPPAGAPAQAAAERFVQGDRRGAIDLFEQAHAADPGDSVACELAALYDGFASSGGDPRDIRLALINGERCLRGGGPPALLAALQTRLARLRDQKARTGPEPPAGRVRIDLIAASPDQVYRVTLGSATCTTPCAVLAPPGAVDLVATGAGELNEKIMIPPQPGVVRIQHRDDLKLITGAILIPVGFLMATTMWTLFFACPDDPFHGLSESCTKAQFITWPLLGAGAMAAGIALVKTARRAPVVNRVLVTGSTGAPLLSLTSLGLGPLRGGAGAGVGFSF